MVGGKEGAYLAVGLPISALNGWNAMEGVELLLFMFTGFLLPTNNLTLFVGHFALTNEI